MPRAEGKVGPTACSVLAALLVLAGTAGCNHARRPIEPTDVLLITIDTARADRFSYTGTPGPATPRIDALAFEGVWFLDAISPSPLTKPAHASLLTGRLPPSHTVRDNGAYRLPAGETTLAEILQTAGYTTGAFVGAQVLDRRYGFQQGFTTYDDTMAGPGDPAILGYAERRGEDVAAAAIRWLDAQSGGKLFAWVHLFDPHAPYRPPEPERSRYPSGYDGEIAYTDRVVGNLVDAWEARRGRDQTLVIVTADHGESLGEHDEATHGVLIHDATIRVPLVIRAPGLRLGAPIAAPVSLIDVLPTVLSLLRLSSPEGVQGRDLGPLMRGERVAWSPLSGYSESLYAELHHGCASLRSLRENGWKLVRGRISELYDLGLDPKELNDLAAVEPDRTGELEGGLERLTAEIDAGSAETETLDDQERLALQSLGYAWTPPSSPAAGGGRDPREALRSMKAMAEADRSVARGDMASAVTLYRDVIAAEPVSVDARVRLAHIFVTHGRHKEALPLLEAAAKIAPRAPELRRMLGDAWFALGNYGNALAAYDSGLALEPTGREIRDARWRVLNQLGRWEEMLAEAERVIASDPTDSMARYARALACCGQGSAEAYIAALERELSELPDDPVLERALRKARAE